jgi:branched-chain amino acid transport system substrate-binding protein
MLRGHKTRAAVSLLAVALLASACTARDDDDDDTATGDEEAAEQLGINVDDCIADPTEPIEGDTIELVSSYPQSGLTAAFSEIARGWKAYFDKVNAEGGVEIAGESYQISTRDMNDEYNPAETAGNIDEMVGPEGDGAFAVFSVVGTANNVAIREQLDELCVPNVFAATGAPAWGNEDYPWLIGSTLAPYSLEGYLFAQVLEEENPEAQVAMLIQNDDFGAAYREGFERAIEDTDIEIVAVESYPTGEGEVAAQVTSLAASGADAFFNGGTLLACPDALSQAAGANWEPITWVSSTCLSDTLMGLAGEAADGVYGAAGLMDPLNPDWDDDPAMVEYLDTIQEYQPDGFDPNNAIVGYGYTQAALFVEALEAADEPTRLAVMESLRNFEASGVGLLLPEITVRTGEGDPFLGEALQISQYDFVGEGERNYFVPRGDIVDFEGETTDLTPDELING